MVLQPSLQLFYFLFVFLTLTKNFDSVSGFGILFIVGVPFTSITQLLPFLMFGIGLDDSFILFGSYIRTDPDKDVVMRIEETIQDVGLSITLTTLTSATAFALGTMSSIPAVFWLCLYSCPTILLVFVYQLTFFVAVIALDERRIAANRRDICICIVVPKSEEEDYNDDEVHIDDAGSQRAVNAPTADTKSHLGTFPFFCCFALRVSHDTFSSILAIGLGS